MTKISGLNLYKHDLLDHAKNPRNYGLIVQADFCSAQLNPSCGDSVTVCGFVQKGMIQRICFEGSGCVLSLAMASKLTSYVVGMSLKQILQFDDCLVEKLLGLELGINRLQCGLLSVKALQQGVHDFCLKNACDLDKN